MKRIKRNSKRSFDSLLPKIEKSLSNFQEKITSSLSLLRASRKRLKSLRSEHEDLTKELADIQTAQDIVHEIVKEIQNRVHQQISAVVTKCLALGMANHPDGPYEFKIKFVKQRNKTDAVLLFVRNGVEYDPKDSSGGGPLDIACFALRLACILSARPALRHLVVLDEPWKHVHLSLRETMAELLLELAKETKTQFIIVTHFSELEIGHVVKII